MAPITENNDVAGYCEGWKIIKACPFVRTVQAKISAAERADRIFNLESQKHIDGQLSLFPTLPITPNNISTINNYIAKSSMFLPAVGDGPRDFMRDVKTFHMNGTSLYYTGEQLDVFDQDVYLQVMRLSSGRPPNTEISLYENQFLKAINLSKSGKNHIRLRDSLERLRKATIIMTTTTFRTIFNLISRYELQYESMQYNNRYIVAVDKNSMTVFFDNQYGFVNMEKRFQLTNNSNLGKWFQAFIAAHDKNEQALNLTYLYVLSALKMRRDKFKTKLKLALDDMMQVGILKYWYINPDDIVFWQKT